MDREPDEGAGTTVVTVLCWPGAHLLHLLEGDVSGDLWGPAGAIALPVALLAGWSVREMAALPGSGRVGRFLLSADGQVQRVHLARFRDDGGARVVVTDPRYFSTGGGDCWQWRREPTLLDPEAARRARLEMHSRRVSSIRYNALASLPPSPPEESSLARAWRHAGGRTQHTSNAVGGD